MKIVYKLMLGAMFFVGMNNTQAQENSLQDVFTQSYYSEKQGNYTLAISAMKKVYDANSYEINLRLGWLSYSAGLYKESLNYYQIAVGIMPYSVEAKLGLVYPAAALGNMTQVMDAYKKILEIDPQNTTANYRMGYVFYDKKDYQSAFSYFEKVVNLYPFGYDGLLMFAWTNYQLGKTREAKVLFNKVLLLSPNDASALEGLALIK
ncbi:MAG: tetratricopeptide repeat protein [Bacteroidetes bacterium]|nr:tetratricopeptide repeat protein [Bacteroidota bacterium]